MKITSQSFGIRSAIVSRSSMSIGTSDSMPSVVIPSANLANISEAAGNLLLNSRARSCISGVSKNSRQGRISIFSLTTDCVRWSEISKYLISSISSPKKSIRTGCSASGKKTSTMPPRTANSPRFSTKSVRVYALRVKCSIKSPSAISWPTSMVRSGTLEIDPINR